MENLHLGRKDHIERLQQRRVQSISEASSRRLKNQALAPSFRTRAPRQTPTSTSSVPSQPSTASHHSSMASQQTSMVTQLLSTESEKVATTPLQMSYVPQQMSAYPCWMPSVSQPLSLAPAVSSAHQIHTHPASAVSAVFTVPHQWEQSHPLQRLYLQSKHNCQQFRR